MRNRHKILDQNESSSKTDPNSNRISVIQRIIKGISHRQRIDPKEKRIKMVLSKSLLFHSNPAKIKNRLLEIKKKIEIQKTIEI